MTPERLRELLHYDPETGSFTWSVERRRKVQKGSQAGCQNKLGYVVIRVDGKLYLAHRLAWLYTYNEWPPRFIDHINANKSDNRLCNLRLACDSINAQNIVCAKSHSSSGVLGVRRYVRRDGSISWRASIRHEGKNKYLGCYNTLDEAQSVYIATKRQLHIGRTL